VSDLPADPSTTDNDHPSHENDPLHKLMRDAGLGITYRPILRQLVGDINAAILLQQIIFYFVGKVHNTFYKFTNPCIHPLYREGDSWTEVLGFSDDEFDTAIKKIGTKVNRREVKSILLETQPEFGPSRDKRTKHRLIMTNCSRLVVYWRQADNTMRYHLNEQLLINAIYALQSLPKVENPLQLTGNSLRGNGKPTSLSGASPTTYNIEDFKRREDPHRLRRRAFQLKFKRHAFRTTRCSLA
jgi:hypothetical protein